MNLQRIYERFSSGDVIKRDELIAENISIKILTICYNLNRFYNDVNDKKNK